LYTFTAVFENSNATNNDAGSDSDDAGFANANRVPRTRTGNMSDASIDSTQARSALNALSNWDGTRQRRGQENSENQTNGPTDNDEEQEESKYNDIMLNLVLFLSSLHT
jgi:hypothetical protein